MNTTAKLVVGSSIAVGVTIGIGIFTFLYAKGASYLSDAPQACANCHVMEAQYAGWLRSSHRSVATCNGCHTPQAFIPKYLVKALNGYNHSVKFTLGNFHEPIRITGLNHRVTEGACRNCHTSIFAPESGIDAHVGFKSSGDDRGDGGISCTRCHVDVGHATH